MHDEKFEHEPRGEFRGDFTRDTFDPFRHFSRVLMQQGRVQLDADWNEQVSIFMHYIRSVVRDIGGEHFGPNDDKARGFNISLNEIKDDLHIGPGHYYVKGLLCQVDGSSHIPYSSQPDYPLRDEDKFKMPETGQKVLVYLDVWERHLSYVEDDYMREKALGGPDTATRAKIVWQVKLKTLEKISAADINKIVDKSNYEVFLKVLDKEKPGSGELRARARKDENNNDPCLTSPESRYRGAENQLYRVEIHKGGIVSNVTKKKGNDNANTKTDNVTFKWSRNNAAEIYPVKKVDGTVITLEHLGRDTRFGLKPNDWVEIVDDDYVLQNRAEKLLQVLEVNHEDMQVTLKELPESDVGNDKNKHKHPYLRRWDQREGDSYGIPVITSPESGSEIWITLEDGVQIQFPKKDKAKYHTGDYWLIPARTATGDVEWPGPVENPTSLTPHGVVHHYAPLALITADNKPTDLRRKLTQIWK